ncbi:MAG TPA: type II secretion system protein GspG [Thermoanaerobaculia bacterium]|nr:type II secretion system protein GspG [Thermoanaerobaculia bacterium]
MATGSGMNAAALIIGVLVAGVVIIAIIGILAAIAIPNLLTAMQRSRQKRTMADIRTIASALEAYGTDHHELKEYPSGTTVQDLRSHLQPTYVSGLPVIDGWTTEIRYMRLPERGYVIVSAGADKKFQAEPDQYRKGTTGHFDCDIVYSNGEFLQYPEGLQRGGGQ